MVEASMRVSVIGTGYVGIVTGACLAHVGHDVRCLDVDEAKVQQLRAGKVPIFEPGLDDLVAHEVATGRLTFTTDYAEAIPGAEAVFICVGTPALPSGRADTSAVEAASEALGKHLGDTYCAIINKSTVPIGSGDWVGMLVRQSASARRAAGSTSALADGGEAEGGAAVAISETTPGPRFDVVSNPEFLREGTAIEDALQPDRIVVGADTPDAVEQMRRLYAPLLERNAAAGREVPFVVTDRASAEMIKYAANAFLATKISFINEIASICERVGADVTEVAQGIGMDHRIGRAFLCAGLGWGGSCFPKDLSSLSYTAQEYGHETRILNAVREVNTYQRMAVIRKLQEQLKLVKGKTIAIWGLAFKPGTDDLRDAPALTIIERLNELGASVRAYDPQAADAAKRIGVKATFCSDFYEVAEGADAVVLVTEWPEFASADWARIHRSMRRPLIVDGRNVLDRSEILWHGFEYCGFGR
jgi:UDPglucose 6-dehydrogenase